jgi:hypothetical protein
MNQTEQLLRADFPESLSQQIVKGLQLAYDETHDHFNRQIGHDEQLFGLMVYKSKTHFLSQLSNRISSVELIHKSPSFRLKIGRYFVAAYRAGDNGDVDISEAFPKNKNKASQLVERNQRQLRLFPDEPELDDSNCNEVIICDVGNSQEGLLSVFLGVPVKKSEDGRIMKWGTTILLWKKDSMSSAGLIIPNQDAPVAANVEPPIITLKEVRESEKVNEKK